MTQGLAPSTAHAARSRLAWFVALALAYGALALLGLQWGTLAGVASPVFPAAGVGLAALALGGVWLWPAIAVGMLAALALTGSHHAWWVQVAIATGQALAPAAAVLGLRLLRFEPALLRLKDATALLALGVAGASALAATVGAAALAASLPLQASEAAVTWLTWFLGDAVGMVTVAPLVLAWGARRWPRSRRFWLHLLACAAAALATAWVAFAGNAAGLPIGWYTLVPLAWAAVAFQARASAIVVLVAAMAVGGTTAGLGPFGADTPDALHILLLQQYLGITAATTLVIGTLTREYRGKEALAATEQRLRVALAAGGMGVWTLEPAGNRADWDDALAALVGIDRHLPAAARATAFFWRIHPDDIERVRTQNARLLEHGGHCEYEFRYRHPDGRWLWLGGYGKAVRDARGRISHLTGVNFDITARKTAEQALAESEARFRHLTGAMPQAVWVLDASHRLIYANARWHAYFGTQVADGVERGDWRFMLHPQEAEAVQQQLRECIARRVPFRRDYRLRRADGQYRWHQVDATPVFDEAGALVRWYGVDTDIHDRQLAEQALRANERLLDALYQTAPVGMWLGDREGRFLRVNEVLAEVHGHPVAAHLGRTMRELVPAVADAIEPHYRQVLDTGRPVPDFEVVAEVPSRPGVVRTWLVSYDPVFGEAHDVVAVSAIVYEVTELRRAQAALLEADRRKDEFLATLAHELRNPLAPIRTGLKLMRRLPADSPQARATRDMMERQMEHMVRLVDDLLDVSRISRGKVELKRERVALADILDTAVAASGPNIDAARHAFVEHRPDEPVYLQADAARLSQVVSNLLNNAAKYTPAGGRIELAARREGLEAVIEVRDTGVGLTAEMLPRVFEMFTQAEQTLDRAQGGLGIGLSLVRQLVELHGGQVGAASAGRGRGSTFTVRLPLAPMRASDPA